MGVYDMCKKIGFLLILIILWNQPLLVLASESFNTSEVDQYVTNYLERNGLPGAQL